MIIGTFTTIFVGIMDAMNLRGFSNVSQRRKALEKSLNIKLPNISHYSLDEKSAASKNCENMVGVAQIPLGVVGPLRVTGEKFNETFFVPLATTEGALVASVNRGCKAVTESGGTITASCRVGATRGPVFYTGNIRNEQRLYEWVKKNEQKLKKAAEGTSKHLKFKKLMFRGLAEYAFIRFAFDTQDAMGMNMATIATEKMIELIEKGTGILCISIAGNFDTDKKPAWINFIENRGYKVWAEATIKKVSAKEILKTSPEKIYDVWLSKNMIGSAMSGSLGFNAHFANIVSAVFIATGQDPAHVVEASMGITTAKITKSGDLYFSIYIPALMVGTVGGGTVLATQKEALSIMGIVGGNEGKNSQKLAEIIGGAVLSGELSLLASLAERSLASSHKKLGRGENSL
ncbi:MAG: hypothetical protein A3D74_03390 [Candidatus Levybacteria bacterium RIFCSPHIGHO2_02_FULL_37_13]|nr:MAG: hypothetical protein A3D74_03390 [Candidatus Levybacteria bacterium RIFCSPHIGHO2_02_FULL_37_13]OGH29800.1 MAG: hypothetical protein A3E40_02305 [Candidatus Levybacteria bacterium RIFCSPHIGHO2_12_FULL_37_9]OGH39989.1 MAG: hypothetical protein A3B41_03355 [Candidatus Levybacteria bacterium RIFCSPLOWO2_01_FULL_37_26]